MRYKYITVIAALLIPLPGLAVELKEGSSTCSLQMSAQPLDGALQEVARQCGANLLYFSAVTAGLTGGSLRGRYTLDEALHRLLDNTNLLFSHTDPVTVRIQPRARQDQATKGQPDPPPTIGHPVAASDGELAEVSVIATAQGFVATRIETPLRDIPQTISIISAEQIQRENAFSLSDVLTDAVGLTPLQTGTGMQTFFSRGFLVQNYAIDGGGSLNSFNEFGLGSILLIPNLAEFDHIEVLRGANALFGADAFPGGEINLIRKRPLDTTQVVSTTSAGSWNSYRQELDFTGPIALDGALRGRADVTYSRRDFFYKLAYEETKSAFGVVDLDLPHESGLTVGGSYSQYHSLPFYAGIPPLSDGENPHPPLNTAYTFDWSRFDTETREAYAQFEHAFSAPWHLKVNATLLDQKLSYAVASFFGPIDIETHDLGPPLAGYSTTPSKLTQVNLEATLTGTADWFGLHEQFGLGADWHHSRYTDSEGGLYGFGPPTSDAYHFNSTDYPDPRGDPDAGLVFGESRKVSIAGIFGSVRVNLDQRWWVTLGLRVTHENFDAYFTYYDPIGTVPLRFSYDNTLSPFGAAQFALNDTYSLYASYADIFLANNGAADASGNLLRPSHGINMETGLKGAWRHGTLNGSIALWKVLEKGVAATDYNNTGIVFYPNLDCCYTSSGRNVSKGVDVEFAGKPTPNWSMGAGYTGNTIGARQDDELAHALPGFTPHHLLKVWTSVDLLGTWSRWSVGGSLRAQSSTSPLYYQAQTQKAYLLVNPRIDFRLNPHWRIGFEVSNLLNKRYFHYDEYGNDFYGEPRGFLARVDWRL